MRQNISKALAIPAFREARKRLIISGSDPPGIAKATGRGEHEVVFLVLPAEGEQETETTLRLP